MKYNNVVAWGIIASIGLESLNILLLGKSDSVHQLAKLGFIIFGLWASLLLLKINK